MSANAKEQFASLKWEQMLADKYMVETCFSKKWESLSMHDKLQLLHLEINAQLPKTCFTEFNSGFTEDCED